MRELWFESDGAADAAASASGHAAAVDADAIPGDDDGNAAPRCRLSITRRRSPTWPTTSTSSRCRKRTTWDPAPRTRPFGSAICITGWTKIISTAVLLPPARSFSHSLHAELVSAHLILLVLLFFLIFSPSKSCLFWFKSLRLSK